MFEGKEKEIQEKQELKKNNALQAAIFNSVDEILNVVRDDTVSNNIVKGITELKSAIENLDISDEHTAKLLEEVTGLKENFTVYSEIFNELKSLRMAVEASKAKEWNFDVLRDGNGRISKIRAIKVD